MGRHTGAGALAASSVLSAGFAPNIPPPNNPPAGAVGAGVVEVAGAAVAGAAPNSDGAAVLAGSVGVVAAGLLPKENIPPAAGAGAGAAAAAGAAGAEPNNPPPPLDGGRPVEVLCSAGF